MSQDDAGRPGQRTSARDGGAAEAADFIAGQAEDLSRLSLRHGLVTLGYLLDMARLEAEEIVRRRHGRDRL